MLFWQVADNITKAVTKVQLRNGKRHHCAPMNPELHSPVNTIQDVKEA